jgi:hypothetical protein
VIRGAKRWEAQVRSHFAFLREYGFRFDHVEENWWAMSAIFLSDALGVEVTRSVEFDRVETTLMRLVRSEAPEVEVWVTDQPVNRVLFDNVLEARAPDVLARLPSGLSKGAVEEQLGLYADLLRTVAPDFLQGNDSALLEGEGVIRARVAANPQQVTIWLPSDASEADEARARAEAERTNPPEVQVVVRRYAR